ncbi:protein of unknown function [Geodermatophilus obscurus]|uniref:DUF222 domain-containing protein n=1 Tax=Geodermatophilus obscurus TaxID=1861 RepID=A0A1M7TP40_9ACTN|nr:DUF222 domain-containing protein [Geodermatophilus obscurus]SHN72475.1 protein of unknown function [Geodermatophilus obscurus]
MFPGGLGVGLTVADLAPPSPEFGPPITSPPALAEVLPVYARTAEEKAAELQRVGQLKAALAAYEVELVAAFAADRPASLDRQPGQPGAAAGPGSGSVPGVGAPEGVSEFFVDELALTLNCARATATVLTEHALTLAQSLPATLAELARGRLDWPPARTMAEELGEKVRGTDPAVIAEVEAAVLPEAAGLSIRRLQDRLRAELAARDAAASDRARENAHQAVTVRRRPVGDGVSELIAGMTDELAAACQARIDEPARRAQQAGDDRPIGMLRFGVLADLIQRPWAAPEPVAAHLDVQVPLGALTSDRFLAGGSPLPAACTRPGSVAEPTGAVAGVPITAAHVRELLAQLDAIGLTTPPGGSIGFSFTDDRGALRAVATLRERPAAAARPIRRPTAVVRSSSGRRRPAPPHPPPPSGGSSAPGTAPAGTPAAPTAPGGPTPTTSSRTPAGRPTDCANLCCLCRRHHRLKTFAPGWTYAMTADGILTVTTPAGITRTSRPPGLHLTGPRVLASPPDRPPPAPDPADDPPPF